MRSKTGAALMLFLTFGLGVVAGVVSHNLYQSRAAEPNTRRNGWSPRNITDDLAQGLNMDAAQKEKLREIISRSRERYKALSQQFRPQYETIRDETRQEIRQILREDQKAHLEEIFHTMDSRHKGHGPPRP
jgi:flagellar motility protein MotE (MotC chaperone)